MNGYNFTERVRKVLAMAREEAVRMKYGYVGTEHILLGLIREGEGVAATVLQNLSVELDDLQQVIEENVPQGNVDNPGPDLPYASRAKKVLELAMASAREENHTYVGTEHLLLGLIREERGMGAQALNKCGVDFASARHEMLRILGTEMPQSTPDVSVQDRFSARGFDQPSALKFPKRLAEVVTVVTTKRFVRQLRSAGFCACSAK